MSNSEAANVSLSSLTEHDLSSFFAHSITGISFSRVEGNRIFGLSLYSREIGYLIIHGAMHDINDDDEICLIKMSLSETNNDFENYIDLSDTPIEVHSLSIIQGGIAGIAVVDCGIALDTSAGMMAIVAGSFPYAINFLSGLFDQKLNLVNFQPFDYSLKKVASYTV